MSAITTALQGKTIAQVLTDDRYLYVQTTDGHEARIEWTCDGPVLSGVAVKVAIDPARLQLAGLAGGVW